MTEAAPPPESSPAPDPAARQRKDPLRASRTSGAWAGVVGSIVLLILLVIFIVQNTESTSIQFLGFDGTAPLAVALLVAAAAGMAIAALVGSLRIVQLRRRVKHDR